MTLRPARRVLTVAQTLDQQDAALAAAGVTETFSDTMSGAKYDRPGLSRNLMHIFETVKALTDRGVTLVSISDGIDSSTAAGRMMIGVLGSLAEYERELRSARPCSGRCLAPRA